MTQQTSIESYRKLKDERVLNQRLWEALEFIIKNGRVVARSIPNAGWKRCATLAAMGLIKNDGVAYDSDTKRTAKVWVPTGVDAAQVKKLEPELNVLATLKEIKLRMEAFFGPDGNPPDNTGEFRELQEAIPMMEAVIVSRRFGKHKGEVTDEMLDELEKKLGVLADQNDKLAAHNIQMMQDIAQLQLVLAQKNTELEALKKGKQSGIIIPG